MFSRRERELLVLLGDRTAGIADGQVRRRFPNPVYRRRLLWGIRRKAAAAAADWLLYARAAEREPRVLVPAADPPLEIPTYREPMAAVIQRLGAALRSRPTEPSRAPPRPP